MKKYFNITGPCIAQKHYMAAVAKKMDAVFQLVNEGAYFNISYPWQYGKTTTLFNIAQAFSQ